MAFRTFFKISSPVVNIFKRHLKLPNKSCYAIRCISLPAFAFTVAKCETTPYNFNWDAESLEHEFLIKQSCTVNINSASQLLTVTLVAIQDTSQRLRESLSLEMALMKQAMEWGDMGTPDEHWERLVDVRGRLTDLKHNLLQLTSYMEYAEKLATVAAEISYLTGNTVASDAMCERIDQANRACRRETEANHRLQVESLDLQQTAIVNSAQMEEMMQGKKTESGGEILGIKDLKVESSTKNVTPGTNIEDVIENAMPGTKFEDDFKFTMPGTNHDDDSKFTMPGRNHDDDIKFATPGTKFDDDIKFSMPGTKFDDDIKFATPGTKFDDDIKFATPGTKFDDDIKFATPGTKFDNDFTL